MRSVTLSSRYQVTIPADIRKSLRLRPGQNLQVFAYEGRIVLIPERNIAELRGFVKGIDTTIEREKDRF